jgi:hypothetical protein
MKISVPIPWSPLPRAVVFSQYGLLCCLTDSCRFFLYYIWRRPPNLGHSEPLWVCPCLVLNSTTASLKATAADPSRLYCPIPCSRSLAIIRAFTLADAVERQVSKFLSPLEPCDRWYVGSGPPKVSPSHCGRRNALNPFSIVQADLSGREILMR